MTKEYRKKPVVIEAIQYTKENYGECVDFYGESFCGSLDDDIIIETLEGKYKVSLGDYIIKGVKGEIYPCKPDIFEMTYDDTNVLCKVGEPEWQTRFRNEYSELKERYNKLHKMLVKHDAGTLEFKPTCPIELLRKQKATMGEYLNILEVRAEIENIRGLDDDNPKLKSDYEIAKNGRFV